MPPVDLTRRSFLAACGAAALPLVSRDPLDRQSAPLSARASVGPPASPRSPGRVLTLQSVDAVPPEIVGAFRAPEAFAQSASGQYFVFDRMAQTVYGMDQKMRGAWPIVLIGPEVGRLLMPSAFALAPNGTFAVADHPKAGARIQVFTASGTLFNGFALSTGASDAISVDGVVLYGVGSLQHTGHAIFTCRPELGTTIVEYSPTGTPVRTFGALRPTGGEHDPMLHHAFNTGIPLLDPGGGFYFVFQTGVPLFRRLDDAGRTLFERHIEGPELDSVLLDRPTSWPTRQSGDRVLPLVPPVVRTAAVDPQGRLWVVLASSPVVYVYDRTGEKIRTLELRGAGALRANSLFFTPDGRLLVTPGCYVFRPVL